MFIYPHSGAEQKIFLLPSGLDQAWANDEPYSFAIFRPAKLLFNYPVLDYVPLNYVRTVSTYEAISLLKGPVGLMQAWGSRVRRVNTRKRCGIVMICPDHYGVERYRVGGITKKEKKIFGIF